MDQFSATIAELAEMVGGVVEGESDMLITGVAVVEDAEEGDLVIADRDPYFSKAMTSAACCILTGHNSGHSKNGKSLLRTDNPQEAFMKLLKVYGGEEILPKSGIATGAVVEEDVTLGENVSIGANCFVGRGSVIGSGTVIYPNAYVGEQVVIGKDCRIYPNVTIYRSCCIGNRVTLHAGGVIGGDGFGFKSCGESGLLKYPHIGSVEIGDDVEIGANSTIDRAKTGKTVIGSGTKIDNLVHIAHNVKIGKNCVVVAQTGVAGSAHIGDGVTLAAQSGVKDHVDIGSSAVIAARSGVIGNVQSGAVVSGFPARDHRHEMRVEAARLHLPEMMKRLRALEKEIKSLRGQDVTGREDEIE